MRQIINYIAMYKTVNFLFALFLSIILFTSCEKETLLELSSSEITATSEGITQTINVTTNKEWSAASSTSWCTIVVTTSDNFSTVKVTVLPNDNFEERSATITITSAELTKTISVTQKEKGGLISSKTAYDLSDESQEIEVEVSSNVEYEIKIEGPWITQNMTKALTSKKIYFFIAKNETYDPRQGLITISQKNGSLKSEISVKQAQLDAILLPVKTYPIPNSGTYLDIDYKTNINVKVVIPESAKPWVVQIATKGLRDEKVQFDLDANNFPQIRSTYIYFYNATTNVKLDSVRIVQEKQANGIYWVRKMGRLNTALIQSQKDTISVMIIKGEINSSDFTTLRSQFPQLIYLDLKDVKCDKNEIPNQAFKANKKLKTITLPNSIIRIGDTAFGDCSGLKGNLIIPESVIEIGAFAFEQCIGLNGYLKLPENLTSLGTHAFRNCLNLSGKLVIPNKLKAITSGAFFNCPGFTGELIIPGTIESVGYGAFYSCVGITKLVLNEGLKSIGNTAFIFAPYLTGKLVIPNTVTYIGVEAFSHCGITGLEFGSSLIEIDRNAFYDCEQLTGILVFPDNITRIGAGAFRQCLKLSGIELPRNLKQIEGEAFNYCNNLTSLNIPENVETIGYRSFEYCTKLSGSLIIPKNVKLIQEHAFNNCTKLSKLIIEEGIQTIERFAFSNCNNIVGEVLLPRSLITIRNDAFIDCNNIGYFKVLWEDPIVYYPNMLTTNKVIKVPSNSVDKYKNADGWKNHPIVGY